MSIPKKHWKREELVELWEELRSRFSHRKAAWIYEYCDRWSRPVWYAEERYRRRRDQFDD